MRVQRGGPQDVGPAGLRVKRENRVGVLRRAEQSSIGGTTHAEQVTFKRTQINRDRTPVRVRRAVVHLGESFLPAHGGTVSFRFRASHLRWQVGSGNAVDGGAGQSQWRQAVHLLYVFKREAIDRSRTLPLHHRITPLLTLGQIDPVRIGDAQQKTLVPRCEIFCP